jgi:tRNA1Val (adenine37-N6)-methyltransferase
MGNPYFQFKQFRVYHDRCAMKVTTDACLFGAWCAYELSKMKTENAAALDIGTGTGLLSLMIAQQVPLIIDAVEIDEGAAGQAAENIASSPFGERVRVVHSDVLQRTKKYEYIIANPPFYEDELHSGNAQKDTAHHSTKLTLEQLLPFMETYLETNGKAFLLLPYKRKAEIGKMFDKSSLYMQQFVTVKPSVQHQPFRIMLQAGFQKMETVHTEISVQDERGTYTAGFSDLLRPYYLYIQDV